MGDLITCFCPGHPPLPTLWTWQLTSSLFHTSLGWPGAGFGAGPAGQAFRAAQQLAVEFEVPGLQIGHWGSLTGYPFRLRLEQQSTCLEVTEVNKPGPEFTPCLGVYNLITPARLCGRLYSWFLVPVGTADAEITVPAARKRNSGVSKIPALCRLYHCQEFYISHFCLPGSFNFIFPNLFT